MIEGDEITEMVMQDVNKVVLKYYIHNCNGDDNKQFIDEY